MLFFVGGVSFLWRISVFTDVCGLFLCTVSSLFCYSVYPQLYHDRRKSMRRKRKKKSKVSSLGSGGGFTSWVAFQDFRNVVFPEETKSPCSMGMSSGEVKERRLVTMAVTWDPALPFSSDRVTLVQKMALLEQCSPLWRSQGWAEARGRAARWFLFP